MMDWDNTRIVMTKRQLVDFLKLVPSSQWDLRQLETTSDLQAKR